MRFNSKTRRIIAACSVAILVGMSVWLAHAEGPSNTESNQKFKDESWKQWAKLRFYYNDRDVKKVRVEMRRDCGMAYKNGKIVADFVVNDKETLNRFKHAIHCSNIPVPNDHEGFSGKVPLGRLIVDASDGTFEIYWDKGSFIIDSQVNQHNRTFHSPELAYLINHLLKVNSNLELPPKVLFSLSGESALQAAKAAFAKDDDAK